MGSVWVVFVAIAGTVLVLRSLLKSVNWLLYESKLGAKQYSLPPGNMGWPLIGNMWSFLRAFKSNNPDTFMASFVSRYKNHHPLYIAQFSALSSKLVFYHMQLVNFLVLYFTYHHHSLLSHITQVFFYDVA